MRKNEWYWIIAILIALIAVFFHQTIFFGKVPFPGDSLVSDFQPWRSTSYLGYGAGGIPNKAQYPDTIRQIYPWKTLVIRSFKQGKLPLWNPYNFGGAPLLANFQSAALYPLNFLYMLFKQIDAWTILVTLQPILAILFTYLYCRRIHIGILGSWLAAFSYGFSGFMSVWLEYNTVGHVILWLPFLLLAIEHNWLLAIAFGNATAILAGHPQVYTYMMALTIIYCFFRSKTPLRVLAFTLLGVGISGIQLIPGIELIANAARSPHDHNTLFTKILIQPWQLLSLPFPNIFGNPVTRNYWPTDTFVGKVTTIGLVPLFFLFSALRRKDSLTKFFLFASGIIVILITANPITYFLYRIPIPLFTSSSPTLMSYLLAFSLSIVCGLGLDFWMTDAHSVKKLVRRTVEVIGGLLLLYILKTFGLSPRAILYGGLVSVATLSLFWIAIKFPKIRYHAITLLLVVHIVDLFMFFNRFNPFVPKPLVFPDHPVFEFLHNKSSDRYWGYGTAGIAANFASQYNIFSPEGYDPLYPKSYGQFLYNTDKFTNTTRSDAAIESHFGDGGLSNDQKRKLLDALSVRYVLERVENGDNAKIPHNFIKVFEFEDWRIFENPNATPRVYTGKGTATIISYEPEKIIIQTETDMIDNVVLTDTWYPGWVARVDGVEIPIEQKGPFRSVPISAGKHSIMFSYEPNSVKYGSIISIASLVVIVIFLLRLRYKK